MFQFLATNEPRILPREKPLGQTRNRQAFYLTSQGEPIFAWLYRTHGAPGDHGVVICSPIGHEQVHAHRSLRHLAQNLADAGHCVARFDYAGTGNSAALGHGVDRHAIWLANVRDVIRWLREHGPCRHVSLMGLRVGAALAYQIASEQDVENLILWEPVVRGRGFVRELKAVSSAASVSDSSLALRVGVNAPAVDGIEAAGFLFDTKLCDALGRIDLTAAVPRCRRALILTRDDMPQGGALLRHLTAKGIDGDERALPGYVDLLADPHFTKVPHQAIADTVSWLKSQNSRLPTESACPAERENVASQTSFLAETTGIRERIVQIRQDGAATELFASTPTRSASEALNPLLALRVGVGELFAILSEPAGQPSELPLIVLANSGAAHHVGPGDLYVKMSRHLAGLGFRCLRLDLAGLGDSMATDPAQENDSYPSTGFRDIDLALQFAQKELGAERVVLMGLCSGAYFAFQSAVQNPNPALVESVLINPLTFYWQDGMTLEYCPAEQVSKGLYYLKAALQPRKWLKLLGGRTKVGFLGGLKILAQRLGLLPPPRCDAQATVSQEERLGHPLRDDLRADLERVTVAGRQLAFFFSRSDPGYGILQFWARRQVKQMCRSSVMSIRFIEEADHTFSRHAARQELIEAICEYLSRRYQ